MNDLRDFFGITRVSGQHGRHIFDRVVGLHVGGLVGDTAIASGVGLVKPVGSKGFDEFPELVGDLWGQLTVLFKALHQLIFLRRHHFGNLLSHRLTQHVGLEPGIAGQFAGNSHDVVLVGDDAVGKVENLFQSRV